MELSYFKDPKTDIWKRKKKNVSLEIVDHRIFSEETSQKKCYF